jgi:hypothetical protein
MWYIYNYKYEYIVSLRFSYFTFYLSLTGSKVSVGVGSWGGMLEIVGSTHPCVMEYGAIHVAKTIFGNFPHLYGICEISHKLYFSQEFSHQYMGNL